MRRAPWILVIFRLLAAPGLIALALSGLSSGVAAALLLSLAVLSDIFDGVIARRMKVVTPALRTWDSRADVVFWLGATAALLLMHPALPCQMAALSVALPAGLTNRQKGLDHRFTTARQKKQEQPIRIESQF